MRNEDLLDEVFHRFVNEMERDYMTKGPNYVKTIVEAYTPRQLDAMFWELEEIYGRMPTWEEVKESFQEAYDYVNRVYEIEKQLWCNC